ncbi:MAG: LTA synthase family protein [Saprospiraceae bacterium]|nr:LTA synthase family protein [Saprospiraceae bacterium]
MANKIFGKYVFPYFKISPTEISIRNNILNLLSSSFLIGLIIIGIRGGLGLAPMGGGHAYFSNKQFLNHAATNASWSFMYSIQQQNWGSPCNYHFMDDQKAEAFLDEFKSYNKNDTAQIIGSVQPNIVLILLEGWPAHITGALGGEKEVTPFFDSLSSEGILFSNIYSSGDRTFKGIPSVLSGFPAFPSTSIIKYIRKMEKLPCIASSLTEEGYDTHFIYGGDLEFKSISSFITHCGYEHITEDSDFEMELALESKWGVHDHHMFERAASEINSLQEPFLSTVVTLSSHEPYEVPMKTVFPGTERSEQFKNSVYYADWSLRKFFEKIKVEEWFDNTIFLLVSDHGRPYPEQVEHWMPEAFKIPALLVGEPILESYSGLIVDKIGSQLDLVTTLLDIVNTNREAYFWGRNLLDESILPFAYYSFENGIGSVSPKGSVIYDRISGQLINPTTNLSSSQKLDFERQKAYLQTLCRIYDEL